MSTDYYFVCSNCGLRSEISFSRQAWGWSYHSAECSFPFLFKHTSLCGEKYINVVSEYGDTYEIPVDGALSPYDKVFKND